jgi:D-inositol-3-phosphate glycosyltransferase
MVRAVRVALISEHASPLAAIGGVDAGGQNVHVAELAAGLVRLGHSVAVYTRRDDPDLPERLTTSAGYEVVHVPAGPAAPVLKDDLWPHIAAFADRLPEMFTFQQPDVVHAHFWMSAWASGDWPPDDSAFPC